MFYCQWWSRNQISTLKAGSHATGRKAFRLSESRGLGRFSHWPAESDASRSILHLV